MDSRNNRIARNTVMLYVRMLLIMAVTLYTSRVVLQTLGAEDYGIYNVIGGVVAMLGFLNNSMAIATQRFLNYEMGKGGGENLFKVFSMSFISYCIIAIVVFVLSETIGLWFILNKLVIPSERLSAAVWIYQFSILTIIFNLLSVPYNAAIIAHERMSAFAYISVLEVVGKLVMAYLITVSPIDKLIFYGLLMCLISLIVRLVYSRYCKIHFEECRVRWIWDKKLLKQLFGFSGWMLAGTSSHLFTTQGVNFLINMFFGPVMNTARAISMQVYNAMNSFALNFMMATRPQIVKAYVQNDYRYMYKLIFSSTKFSFILLLLLSLPILLHTDYILVLWLGQVPEYTSLFVQLTIIDLLISSSFSPIASLSQASGKIKNYQLIISIGYCLIFIVTWILYRESFLAYATCFVSIIINLIGVFARVFELNYSQCFPTVAYIKQVLFPIFISFLVVFLISCFFKSVLVVENSIVCLLLNTSIYWGITCIIVWALVLDSNERKMARNMVYKTIHKLTFK